MSLLDLFRPVVIVRAGAEHFSFVYNNEELVLQTVMRIRGDGWIIEIGEEARAASGGALIEFFASSSIKADNGYWPLEDPFAKFCKYGIALVLSGTHKMLRPRVDLRNVSALEVALGSEAANIVGRAFLSAGVRSVALERVIE